MKFSKLVLIVNGNTFEIEGPGDLELTADFLGLVGQFFSALSQDGAAQLEAITGELRRSNDDLESSTHAQTGITQKE